MAVASLSSRKGANMKPGLFEWRKSGRAWVADIGSLSLIVNERGSQAKGLRWRVREILGASNWGSGWLDSVEDAILEAEAIAIREALPALRKIETASSKKRSRP